MSRHRAVKNLDLADELDDGGFDAGEDYYADMTSEQQAQMASALSAVQAVLGPNTAISDRAIQDALWDSYFDVDGTVAFLLDEQHKKEERKRKEEDTAPSASLASLSLSNNPPPPVSTTFATPPADAAAAAAPAAPKNKLAAKMAANRAAKAAAAAAAAASAPAPPSTATAPPAAAAVPPPTAPPAAAPPPEKKLSKLQQKMLAAKAGKGGVGAAPTPAAAPLAESAPLAAEEDTPMSPPPAAPPAAAPALFSSPALLAAPSPFASALSPSSRPFLEPVARRIANSLSVAEAVERGKLHAFGLSPDDRVAEARKGTKARLAKQARKAAASQPSSAKSSRPSTPSGAGPSGSSGAKISLKKAIGAPSAAGGKPAPAGPVNALRADMEAMGLDVGAKKEEEEQAPPAVVLSKEKVLKEIKEKEKTEKPTMSLVVVGHVDAGKSTLMGRLLAELGETSEKEVNNFQRQSEKIGKSSFAYAWTFDAMEEERERGVTIDVAIDSFQTRRRRFTLIDAPGHRDFIPNMISGASQADAAVLVVDGASGAFEKGFAGGGQTREHALLVRSLGVQQLIVAVNKMDQVEYSRKRFEAIRDELMPFLLGIGFQEKKVEFCPVGAFEGENLVEMKDERLKMWWDLNNTLVQFLDLLEVPPRALESPLRIPVQNVFKGQSATASGLAISGRVESGIVQVGEKLAALPGDESGVVRALEVDGELVPYASAGQNATVFLSSIDAVQLNVGSVLCPPTALVPLASSFTAQIIVFEPKHPITAGYAIELFHHSRDIPATIVGLEALLDKATGKVTKGSPRMLTKNCSARVRIQLRPAAGGRSSIPIEPFSVNKSMGRVVLRRNGETVAAGVVLETMQ
ncbi:hypothetical protein JCM6882_003944 [Rhodosporidiobolus microsporus]